MQKPTSRLLAEIIEFVTHQPKIVKSLNKRDTHPEATGTHLSCRFYKHHKSDPKRSAYNVVFGYYTEDDNLEKSDDIYARVEVVDGNPPTFKLLGVKFD